MQGADKSIWSRRPPMQTFSLYIRIIKKTIVFNKKNRERVMPNSTK